LGWLLLFAFIGIPLIEIAVFIKVGGIVGLGPTLVIVVLTAVIGTALLRRQGLATLNRARQQLNQGALPLAEIFDAVCLLVAGAFLLTPGFVTDSVGAILLIPAARLVLRRFIGARVQMADIHGNKHQNSGFAGQSDIIDGDFADVTDASENPPDASKTRLDGLG
jgi:UPF0716 protein FxsA